ncbi:MAG TPA: TIGR01777 family oxidoreductase [Herpetosiphonaceae bacterium]
MSERQPQTVAVTGATGTLGRPLIDALLARGDQVIALVRDPGHARLPAGVELRSWRAGHAQAPLAGADAVINLAGAPVAADRWTRRRKAEIVASRIDGTRSVVAGIRAEPRVKALLSASAVEYTGDTGETIVSEDSPPGTGFLSALVQCWEAEALRAPERCRVVLLRKGVVLTPAGGMLKTLLPLFRLGLGGPLGDGRQWLPWIHPADDLALTLAALDDASFSGPLLSAAPNPIRQREFVFLLAEALRRPALGVAPAWALRLALGEMSRVVLASCNAAPRRPAALGYRFRFPVLTKALADLLGR